jgi:hypothetical protein
LFLSIVAYKGNIDSFSSFSYDEITCSIVEKLIGQKLESRVEEMLSHAQDAATDRTLPGGRDGLPCG